MVVERDFVTPRFNEVLESAMDELSYIPDNELQEARRIGVEIIDAIYGMELKARSRPRNVFDDTDVVWVVSAIGYYSANFPLPEGKEDRWSKPWTNEMYRHRLRTGAALVSQVTALRSGKSVRSVSKEDIKFQGPLLLYNPEPNDRLHIEAVLGQNSVKIPSENTYVYYNVDEGDGSVSPIRNTYDQVRSIHFPSSRQIRRISIVSHSPDLVRMAYILDMFRERIPPGVAIQSFPIRMPSGSEEEYVSMAIKGTLANIYKLGRASKQPIEYCKEVA